MSSDTLLKDPLTGAYTRASLQHRLEEEVDRSLHYQESFSLLLLDLDHFKSVNDAFGHLRGDAVLVEFVERLRAIVRNSDILFRYGGDEFVLLLPHTPKAQAFALAQRILDLIRDEPFAGEPPLTLSLSIGVAGFPEDGQTPETLFEKTDLRQYDAKRRGRGQVVSENIVSGSALPFDDVLRLVEREDALQTLQRFLKKLPDKRRGTLLVSGPAGAGRTRFLGEVSKLARLQGYEVVTMSGGTGISRRSYGVFTETFKEWDLPSPLAGTDAFAQGLQTVVEARNRTGLLIAADDIVDFDWASLELLRYLFVNTSLPRLALACSIMPEHLQRTFLPESQFCEMISLGSLSMEGIRVWIRSAMLWEPQPDFLQWLFEQSQALPGNIEIILNDLIEREIFIQQPSGWILDTERFALAQKHVLLAIHQPQLHNLPTPPTNFVGREQEIQQAKDLLSESRLLTIRGTGGIGKTRLGLQVASELVELFAQGVYFIPLADLAAPEFIVPAVAEAMGLGFHTGEPPKTQLIRSLHDKQVLLLLDNFEHLVEGASLVADLLESAPNVRIIVTSRERLNLRGEVVLELKGMSFPTEKPPSQLELYSAVQLFLSCARQVQPNFTLSEKDRPHLAHICQLVEGLPLGIELSAAWVRVLSLEEIAKEIESSIDFLVTPLRDVPERHRSLRAVFEHSWNLLSQEERDAFKKLAVFSSGFRKEGALKVCGAGLHVLYSLVDKSLLHSNVIGRFAMHEALKLYALEKLQETPAAAQETRTAHSQFYGRFVEDRSKGLKESKQKEILHEITEEIDNVRAAWQTAVEQHNLNVLDKLVAGIYDYYSMLSMLSEGKEMFARAADCLSAETAADRRGQELLGKIYARLGGFYLSLSQYPQAKEYFDSALAIFHGSDNPAELALLQLMIGNLHETIAEYGLAEQGARASLEIYRQINDQNGVSTALNELGVIAYSQGDYLQAREMLEESCRICRQNDNPYGTSRALINLGNIACELGEYEDARRQYRESLAIVRELGDPLSLSVLVNNLGDLAREQGEFVEASELLWESVRICRDIGDKLGLTISLNNLGDIAIRQGRYPEAQRFFEQSLAISLEIGNRLSLSETLTYMGIVDEERGHNAEALHHYRAALKLAAESNAAPQALRILTAMAGLFVKVEQAVLACEIGAFIRDHTATSASDKERVKRLMADLSQLLPPEARQAAEARGRIRRLEETIEFIRNHPS